MTEIQKIDQFKLDLAKTHAKTITNFLNNDKEKANKFMSACTYCTQKNPKLLACDQSSLFQAFLSCAEFDLVPSSISGQSHVIPYYNNKKSQFEAQFQLGYKGATELMYRGGADAVYSDIVYENDGFEYESGLNPVLKHKPSLSNRGIPIAAYVWIKINGEKIFKVMSKDEILRFKKFSKGGDSKFSPWNPSQDPELWMWRKTVIKQAWKLLPRMKMLELAIAKDNESCTLEAMVVDAESVNAEDIDKMIDEKISPVSVRTGKKITVTENQTTVDDHTNVIEAEVVEPTKEPKKPSEKQEKTESKVKDAFDGKPEKSKENLITDDQKRQIIAIQKEKKVSVLKAREILRKNFEYSKEGEVPTYAYLTKEDAEKFINLISNII